MRALKIVGGLLVAALTLSSNLRSQVITNPRAPAEFEEVQGVVVNWFEEQYLHIFAIVEEHGGWTQPLLESYQGLMNTQTTIIQEALNEGIEVYVLDDTSHNLVWNRYYSDYVVSETLAALGLSSPSLQVIPQKGQNSVWSRDWGPYSIYKNKNDSLYLAGRPFNQLIADYLSRPFYQTTIMDGGNYLTDGQGKLFCDAMQPDIDLAAFGLTDSVLVANYKVHIDYYLKLINEETFIINEIPFSNYNPNIDFFFGDSLVLKEVIQKIQQGSSCYGRPYKFVKIKTAPTHDSSNVTVFTSEASYANSLFLNRTVLVPQYEYSLSTDTMALKTYRQFLPGYRIVGIPARHFAGMGGTIHCITREIASEEPVFISHAWYPDTVNQTSDYQIRAIIQTRSGVASATVFWTTDTTAGFQSIAMNTAGGDTFLTSIPGQSYGTRVFYYLEAAANSSRIGRKPLVAPNWAYNFLVFDPDFCVAKPGDATGDGNISPADLVFLINHIFKQQPAPDPLCRGDVTANGVISPADLVYLINYLFKQGPEPLKSGACCL